MSTALYATLDALSLGLQELGFLPPEYVDRMMHKVPKTACVDRAHWLLNRLTAKTILHVGCEGLLHEGLLKVCTKAYGVDHIPAVYPDYRQMDLEGEELPTYPDVEVVLLAEILEHLVSPGVLLWQVRERYPACEVIVTVPNCYGEAGQAWIRKGIENVNMDHCFWFSYRTLLTLIEKCGYCLKEWYWYGGKPLVAEGLIFVCRATP